MCLHTRTHTHSHTPSGATIRIPYQIYNNKKMTRNCPHIYLVREISCFLCPLLLFTLGGFAS